MLIALVVVGRIHATLSHLLVIASLESAGVAFDGVAVTAGGVS
jgi:hypothetical protein